MATFKYVGDQPRVYVDIPDPDGNGTWTAHPGDTIDLDVTPDVDDDGNPIVPWDGLQPVKPKTAPPAGKKTADSAGITKTDTTKE